MPPSGTSAPDTQLWRQCCLGSNLTKLWSCLPPFGVWAIMMCHWDGLVETAALTTACIVVLAAASTTACIVVLTAALTVVFRHEIHWGTCEYPHHPSAHRHAVRGYEALLGSRPWGIWDPLDAGFCADEQRGAPRAPRDAPHECGVWVAGCCDAATEAAVLGLLREARRVPEEVLRVRGPGPGIMALYTHPRTVRPIGVQDLVLLVVSDFAFRAVRRCLYDMWRCPLLHHLSNPSEMFHSNPCPQARDAVDCLGTQLMGGGAPPRMPAPALPAPIVPAPAVDVPPRSAAQAAQTASATASHPAPVHSSASSGRPADTSVRDESTLQGETQISNGKGFKGNSIFQGKSNRLYSDGWWFTLLTSRAFHTPPHAHHHTEPGAVDWARGKVRHCAMQGASAAAFAPGAAHGKRTRGARGLAGSAGCAISGVHRIGCWQGLLRLTQRAHCLNYGYLFESSIPTTTTSWPVHTLTCFQTYFRFQPQDVYEAFPPSQRTVLRMIAAPGSPADAKGFAGFCRYLGDKQRAGVVKGLSGGRTAYLIPHSADVCKALHVPVEPVCMLVLIVCPR